MRRTLLAVLAHPDDESYGIGGTLARYAAEGADVHVTIATDGGAGSTDERWSGDRSRLAEARALELEVATGVLGATLHRLGYRDSGYIGDPAGANPEAFINVDPQEVVGRLVGLIRQIRPQVLITHDETGGSFHPDHIQCCKLTTVAFHAAAAPDRYPQIGPEPFRPSRLYYTAFSNRWVRVAALMMRLRGIDPERLGRNGDMDFTRFGVPPGVITTSIDFRRYWDVKRQAAAAHASQGGGISFQRYMPEWLQKLILSRETFIRANPPASPGLRETDLFEPT